MTGDKAQTTFAVLVPHIDFEERLKDREELARNIKMRRLDEVSLEQVEKRWEFFGYLNKQRVLLEATRSAVGTELSKATNEECAKKVEKLKIHLQLVKEDLNNLKDYFYEVEESAVLKVLELPNILHPLTPEEHETVIHSHLELPVVPKTKSHLEHSDCIEYASPLSYFLKSDAAKFELSVVNNLARLLSEANFSQFSNAETVRTVIVEGCGSDPKSVLTLERLENDPHVNLNELHLVGSASLYAFMAYFARHQVLPAYFPLNLFCAGKTYRPIPPASSPSLLNVMQESTLGIFIATHQDHDSQLESTISCVKSFYTSLGYHFRLVFLPAKQLERNESLRLSIQMYSCHLQKYIEVGHISTYDRYLSKRLLLTYSENKERFYPKVIAGSLLRIPRLLACVLEYSDVAGGGGLRSDSM